MNDKVQIVKQKRGLLNKKPVSNSDWYFLRLFHLLIHIFLAFTNQKLACKIMLTFTFNTSWHCTKNTFLPIKAHEFYFVYEVAPCFNNNWTEE